MRYRQIQGAKKAEGKSFGAVGRIQRMVRLIGLLFSRLFMSVMFVGLLASSYWVFDVVNQPIKRIEITSSDSKGSSFQFFTEEDIVNSLQFIQGKRLLSLNISQVEAVLHNNPLIQSAIVRRIWPNRLVIEINDRKLLAYWKKSVGVNCKINFNQCGFISADGVLVKFKKPILLHSLKSNVILVGDYENGRILRQYALLNRLLKQSQLSIVQLRESRYGSMSLYTQDGIQIKLGSHSFIPKVNRVVFLWNEKLFKQRNLIKSIDARYKHGVAVEWKTNVFTTRV